MQDLHAPGPEYEEGGEKRRTYVGTHFPGHKGVKDGEREEVIMRGTMTWEKLEGRYRSGGVTHRYLEEHPEEKTNPEGDIVTRLIKRLKEKARELGVDGEEFEVESPVVLAMWRRAA